MEGLRGPQVVDPVVQFQTGLRELIQRHLGWTKPPTREQIMRALEAEAAVIRASLPAAPAPAAKANKAARAR